MLSIGKLGPGGEEYYLRQVAGPEEYYLGAGEAPGVWLGSGSAELGLAGEVSGEELSAVLGSRSPIAGSSLTGRAVSPERHVPGFDLTFSAPKSVSLLYGLTPPEVSEAVRVSHDEAVADALSYLEAHAAFTRRGTNGVRRIPTSGFVAAGFRQRTSRKGDPQLHTHVVVANAVRGTDGRWSSLHASLVYHHGRTAGFVYQAALRAGLVSRLGVRFEPAHNGMAEIAGVPAQLLRAFSSRRIEVEAHLAEVGASSARAAQIAALKTRQNKHLPGQNAEPVPLLGLRERWQEEARAMKLDPAGLVSALGRPRRPLLTTDHLQALAGVMLGPEGLTKQASCFERRAVVRALAERLPDGARLPMIEEGVEAVLADARLVHLGSDGRGGEEKLTTAELVAREADMLALAEASRGARAGLVDRAIVEAVLGELPSMAVEQAEMVRAITTSGAGIEVVIGKAGAGKTYALDAARAAWQRGGFRVQGATLAARAAAELESGAGIESTTLARLFRELDRGERVLSERDVVVLDEAGMVGSRALHRLVSAVTRAGGKLVACGDPRQLPEIEAGGGLRVLSERLGATELTENRRQETDWERVALDQLRHGDAGAGVAAYDEHDRLHRCGSAASARIAMVSGWAACRSTGCDARMYALRRSDVDDLNALARVDLRRRGELGEDLCSAGEHSYAAGDEVLFCRNDRGLDVLNGTRGKVLDFDDSHLVVETDKGLRRVPIEYLEAGHLPHGYACTVHKSQGATVERAFVLGGDALYREAGYVAMSRATSGTDMFVATSTFDDGTLPEIGKDPVSAGLVRALSESRAKELAVESLERAGRSELLAATSKGSRHCERAEPARSLGHDSHSPARDDRDGRRGEVARSSDATPHRDPPGVEEGAGRFSQPASPEPASPPPAPSERQELLAMLGVSPPEDMHAELAPWRGGLVEGDAMRAEDLDWKQLAVGLLGPGCDLDEEQATVLGELWAEGLSRRHGPEQSRGRGR